jgi:hypothetical protein
MVAREESACPLPSRLSSAVARFGPRWPDAYVSEWARSARALGADDLPGSQAELVQALASCRSVLEPVPAELRQFLTAPPGLGPPEQIFYRGLTSAAALLVSPTIAPYTGTPGWGRGAACRRPVRSYAACSWWSGRAARRRRRRARG